MNRFQLIFFGIFLAAAVGCNDDLCGNQVAQEVSSPTRNYRAIVFERDCGATTGFSTQVSILPANKKLKNEPGNIFAAEGDRHGVPLDSHGAMGLKVEWKGDHELRIGSPGAAQVFRKIPEYQGVRITYDVD